MPPTWLIGWSNLTDPTNRCHQPDWSNLTDPTDRWHQPDWFNLTDPTDRCHQHNQPDWPGWSNLTYPTDWCTVGLLSKKKIWYDIEYECCDMAKVDTHLIPSSTECDVIMGLSSLWLGWISLGKLGVWSSVFFCAVLINLIRNRHEQRPREQCPYTIEL